MNCSFSLCDFYNIIIGGIITGVVASFLFIPLSRLFSNWGFRCKYSKLQSAKDVFDWTAYSMSSENGRIRDSNPNGSTANINITRGKITVTLKHDDRKWEGQIKMLDFNFGMLTLKYENEHEYGRRDCIIGSYIENAKKYDYLFLMPSNPKIYYLTNEKDNRSIPHYQYGNEILIRERDQN